ncbi:MAG: hypothetical protein Q8M23_01280 [Bacteroidales bacterium]|nr:hypothetical protein [Bacteroidales bacterium]
MRTIILFTLICFLFLLPSARSQEFIKVEQGLLKAPKGDVTAFKVKIHQGRVATVAKAWQKTLTRNTRSKVKASANEFFIENVIIDKISDEPMNIYSALTEQSQRVELVAAFELEGVFMDEYNTRQTIVEAAKSFMLEFAIQQYKVAVQGELDKEEKVLKSLQSNLNQLMKQNTDYRKTIASREQKIMSTEEEIKGETSQRERKYDEIVAQRIYIGTIKNDPEQLKAHQASLKKMENDRKKMLRKIESMHKKIVSLRADIQKAHRDIAINEGQQKIKNNEIGLQMSKISDIEKKLQGIH